MTTSELTTYYGSINDAAQALGVSRQTVYNWQRRGVIPPRWEALVERELAKRTKGKTLTELLSEQSA